MISVASNIILRSHEQKNWRKRETAKTEAAEKFYSEGEQSRFRTVQLKFYVLKRKKTIFEDNDK